MSQALKKKIKKSIQAHELGKVMTLIGAQEDVDGAARQAVAVAIELGDEALAMRFLPLMEPTFFVTFPLIEASRAGMAGLVEKLVDLCDAEDVDALCEASAAGHLETVKMLLRHTNARDQESQALVNAAKHGHEEVVNQLIFCSEPKARNSEALVQACANGHAGVVKLLLPVSSKIQCALRAFSLAAHSNHLDVIDVLLDAGLPDPEDTYTLGVNEAAREGHLELTGRLLWAVVRTGCKPPRFGAEALVEAASRGHAPVVEVILKFADRTDAFEQAICAALRQGHSEVVDLLVRRVDLSLTQELIVGEELDEALEEAVARWESAKQQRELQQNDRRRARAADFSAQTKQLLESPRSPRL